MKKFNKKMMNFQKKKNKYAFLSGWVLKISFSLVKIAQPIGFLNKNHLNITLNKIVKCNKIHIQLI